MASNKLEERIRNRRGRRWKRRARIAAPFAGIPLLFGLLALSVDVIEYEPQEARPKLSDRPLPEEVRKARPETPAARRDTTRAAISTSAMMDAHRLDATRSDTLGTSPLEVEMPIPSTTDLRPPARPYATRR